MSDNFKYRSDRNVGPVLAASIVITLGGGCLLVLGSFAFPRDLHIPILIAAAFILGALFVIWQLQDRPKSTLRERFSWIGSKRHREGINEYEPKIVRESARRYGTRRPPTLDDVRDLKDSPTNWVPSHAVSGRKSVKDR